MNTHIKGATIAKRDRLLTFKRSSANVVRKEGGFFDYAAGEDAGIQVWASLEHLSGAQAISRGLPALESSVKIVFLTDDIPDVNLEYTIIEGEKKYKPVSVRVLDSRERQTEIVAQIIKV